MILDRTTRLFMDIVLHQEKFHRIMFKAYRIRKLKKEDQTIRNFLCYYQELACQKYATEQEMEYALSYHYDAKFKVSLTSFGKYSVLEYSLTVIDPSFIGDQEYTLEAVESLFEALIIAKMEDHQADLELYERAYEIYESDLLAKMEKMQGNALRSAIKAYFCGTDRDYETSGNLEELKKMTPKILYDYYQDTLNDEYISLVTGNLEAKEDTSKMTLLPKKDYHFKERSKTEEIIYETAPCEQCYLQVFYETYTYANDQDYYACMFLNYIFGGGSSSKLFSIVREKYGLCYSAHSMYLGATGILIVAAIINLKDVEKVLQAYDEALEEIARGQFDIENIRNYYLSTYRGNLDYQGTTISNYITDHYFLDSPKSYEEVAALEAVTLEQMQAVLKKLKRTFVYVYGGVEDGK